MIIPIVLATDRNYLAPTIITLLSMGENKKRDDNKYDVTILTSGNVENEEKQMVCSVLGKRNDFSVSFCDMKDMFASRDMHSMYITPATYYRLMLPSLLPDVDVCLYLDTDIVVCEDLASLYHYHEQMQDRYLIAGVREFPKCVQHYRELGLTDAGQYFNAGVILINLKQIREAQLGEVLLKESLGNHVYHDQDVLNKVCAGRVLYLPLKYNKMIKYFYHFSPNDDLCVKAKAYFAQEGYEEAVEQPVILHYSSPIKPWWGIQSECTLLWWEYYKKVPTDIKKKVFDPFLKREHRGKKYEMVQLAKKIKKKGIKVWRIITRKNSCQ